MNRVRIDIHAHLFPSELPDFAERFRQPRWPLLRRQPDGQVAIWRDGSLYRPIDERYWSHERRLQFLDAYDLDHQVVSPLPVLLPHWAPEDQASEFCCWQNEAIASYVAAHPDRLSGFGTVPVHHPKAALAALDQVVDLGLAGVEIGTSAAGGELDDEAHRLFFAAAADRDLPVLVHPLEGEGMGRMQNFFARFGVGVLADTGIAGVHLLLSGILRSTPGLRVCLAHGGGAFFWALPRLRSILERSLGPEEATALAEDMRGVWADTASLGPENLRYLDEVVGRDRLVIGSDYPATADSDPLSGLAALGWHRDRGLCASNAAAFLGRNARS